MAWAESFNVILDPVLKPLLKLGPIWAILIVSFLISVVMTLIYWWLTDQKRMKEIKETTKKLQADLKKSIREDPKKAGEIQKKILSMSKEQMKSSLKSTFVTMIPILIIFWWLSSHVGYYPILAGDKFDVTMEFYPDVHGKAVIDAPNLDVIGNKTKTLTNRTSKANAKPTNNLLTWTLQANETGKYTVDFDFNGKTYSHNLAVKKKIVDGYLEPVTRVKDGHVKTITTKLKKVTTPIFGLNLGWLWVYIISSLVFSMGMRKVFKIY